MRCRTFIVASVLGLVMTGWARAACEAPPLVPNPTFKGDHGSAQGVTGTVPDGWRAFAVGGGVASTEIVPIAAGELYPGSPATNGVKFTVTTKGTDQGLDHDSSRMPIDPLLRYEAEFYVRTGNADSSNQAFALGFPVFDASGTYLLREPGGNPTTTTATSSWQKVHGRAFMDPAARYGTISFRLAGSSTAGSFIVALPSVTASADLAPNPSFGRTGNGGSAVSGGGTLTGQIPDQWRGFSVSGSVSSFEIVPLAAGELYPGSPATNAVRFTVTTHLGDEGLDTELTRFSIFANLTYQASFYIKTGNADNSSQPYRFNTPVFSGPAYDQSAASAYLGREPGGYAGTATASWQPITTAAFQDASAASGKIGWRLGTSATTGSIMVALPSLKITNSEGNFAPNTLFAGSAGTLVGGGVTGTVPTQWRAVAVSGSSDPPVLNNPDFEIDAEGTKVVATGAASVINTTTFNAWRFFATGTSPNFAAGSATVTSAAASSGTRGIELTRDNTLGSSALDMDTAALREPIPPQQRIYKLLVDARDGGPRGGTSTLGLMLQFADTSFNRGISVDPGAAFEPFGMTARSDGGKTLSVRMDLGTALGSAHVDNVRLTDATTGVDRTINGGFENSATTLSTWRFFATGVATGTATLSGDAHGGARAALLNVTAGGTDDIGLDLNSNKIAALAGEQVTISFWAKKVAGGDTRLRLSVSAHAADSTFLGEAANVVANPGTGAYENYTVTFTVPANGYQLNLGLRVVDPASATREIGSYLIDDVSVVGLTSFPFTPAAAQIAKVPVAADELYAGSPATAGVLWRQTQFGANGGDAQIDHDAFRFPVKLAQPYQGGIYVKTANSDASAQQFTLYFRLYSGTTLLGEAGSITATAGGTWTLVQGPTFQSMTATAASMGVRLVKGSGTDNAIVVALPSAVAAATTGNRVPNTGFAGSGGTNVGVTGGPVPDQWRAFAVSGAAAELAVAPVAADAIYPGSPATNAVLLRRTAFAGDAGFDNAIAPFPLKAGTRYRGAVYAMSANTDANSQQFRLNFPIFKGTTFLGREPGLVTTTIGTSWQRVEGPAFSDAEADNGSIGFRVMDDGGDNAVWVALPDVQAAVPTVTAVSPASGRGLMIGVTINGSAFSTSAGQTAVYLTRAGQSDIVSDLVTVSDTGTLQADFNLTGAAAGPWDVVVCVAGSAGTLPNGFAIVGCGRPFFADSDGDGDVDQLDFAAFQLCYTLSGDPAGAFNPAACACFDRDNDDDVDAEDLMHFIICASGPGVPADTGCPG